MQYANILAHVTLTLSGCEAKENILGIRLSTHKGNDSMAGAIFVLIGPPSGGGN